MDINLYSKILGEGRPLLILHGFLGMGDNWKTLANRFAKDYQVHLIDQRNHGRSFHADAFNYEVLVDDLLNYINHYNLERVTVLGHSMGGKTAMLFAVNFPEKIHSLIVADIGPKFYPNHHEEILKALNEVDFENHRTRASIDEVLEEHIPEFSIRQFLLRNVYRISKEKLAYRFNLKSLSDNYDEVGVPLPSLTQFDGNTLFLRGENSGYIRESDLDLINAHFEKAEVLTVKNAGHWLHAENPDDFYDYVVSFLKK